MPVLALDTSADIAVAVLGDDPGRSLLAGRRVAEQRRHAEMLAPMVVEALDEAGVDRRDLTSVVVGTGPAPFTGLRAGLVTARTLALALDVPVHGVCSLDALAAQAIAAGPAEGGDVVVVSDARRREVYTARYRAVADGGERGVPDLLVVDPPAVVYPADLAAALADRPAVVVGPGAGLYPEHLAATSGAPTVVDPAVLARLAARRLDRGEPLPTEPLYLRRPDVVASATRKRATG